MKEIQCEQCKSHNTLVSLQRDSEKEKVYQYDCNECGYWDIAVENK